MSSADSTYHFTNSAVKCALESVLSFGEDTRFGGGGCLRRMLEIPHIKPYDCPMTCNLPTVLPLDDLAATLRLFFNIFGALDEWIWFTVSRTGGQRERSEQLCTCGLCILIGCPYLHQVPSLSSWACNIVSRLPW